MKEQTRNTEEEIGKVPEKEFRIMIIKLIKTTPKIKKCKKVKWLSEEAL